MHGREEARERRCRTWAAEAAAYLVTVYGDGLSVFPCELAPGWRCRLAFLRRMVRTAWRRLGSQARKSATDGLITDPLVETQASRSAWLTLYGFEAVWKRVVFRSVFNRARSGRRNEQRMKLLSPIKRLIGNDLRLD